MTTVQEMYRLALHHRQAGRLPEAEVLYRQVLQAQPDHPDALNNLGNVLQLQGRFEEAIVQYRQAVALRPDCAEVHNNIGAAFYAQGKREEAAGHYQQALAIKPDYVEAHMWLGKVRQEQGKPDEAERHYRQALALKPDFADAHYNIGLVLGEQEKYEEAVRHYRQALACNPRWVEAHCNLGNALDKLGRFKEAMEQYRCALAINPRCTDAMNHYAMMLVEMKDLDRFVALMDALPADLRINETQGRVLHILKAILCFLKGDWDLCRESLASGRVDMVSPESFPFRDAFLAYQRYLDDLLGFRASHQQLYMEPSGNAAVCHILGDSHCLGPAWTHVTWNGSVYRVVPHLIIGCKAWHLANGGMNHYKQMFQVISDQLPGGATVVIAFGEIDCRKDTGILTFYKKHPGKELRNLLRGTAEGYVAYVTGVLAPKKVRLCFHGVPAPSAAVFRHDDQDMDLLVEIVKGFNDHLSACVRRCGHQFIDVYNMTAGKNGIANGAHHIDKYHLRPDYWDVALNRHLAGPE